MLAVVWKDLVLETRSRDTVLALFALGLIIMVVFNFALDVVPANVGRIAPGILWVAIAFSGISGFGRAFLIERDNECMAALLASPLDRGSVFLAKLLVNLAVLLAFEVMLLPVFALMFDLSLLAQAPGLALIMGAVSLGLAASGTLFSLPALATRARELMLPLLVLPLQVPLLMAAVKATAALLAGSAITEIGAWGQVILAFDLLFVTCGWLAFEFITVD